MPVAGLKVQMLVAICKEHGVPLYVSFNDYCMTGHAVDLSQSEVLLLPF